MQDQFESGPGNVFFFTQRMTAEEWKETLRMNHETFLKLCDDLRPSLEGQATLKDANAIIGRKTSCCLSIILQMKEV